MYYDLPTPVTLYIKATVQAFDGSLDADYIIAQLVPQLNYNIGERAESANITTILKEIIADMGTVYDVELSLDELTWVEYLTPTGLDEFLNVTTSSVTITLA